MVLKSIYIISTLEKSQKHEFKMGKHKGSQKKLLSRYRTYLVDPIIFYFRPVINYNFIENKIKSKLKKFRISDEDNNLTEWIKLELFQLISYIDAIITIYSGDSAIDNINDSGDDDNNNNELSSENLHPLFEHIKESYVKKGIDIDMKFTDFYNNYLEYAKTKNLDPSSKIEISKLLAKHQLTLIIGRGNVRYIKIPISSFNKIYN